MAKDSAKVAAKWKQRLSASTEQIKDGIMATTQPPGQKAAAKVDKWLAGIQGSRDKFQRRVGAVSLQDWQQSAIRKGLPRIATGAQESEPKVQRFMAKFLPHVEAGQRMLEGMPDDNLEARLQRMVAMARHNSTFEYS